MPSESCLALQRQHCSGHMRFDYVLGDIDLLTIYLFPSVYAPCVMAMIDLFLFLESFL